MILTKLDQHVSEMLTTAGKKFHNFLSFRFLIIMQNINMAANGKRNRRLNPVLIYVEWRHCEGNVDTTYTRKTLVTERWRSCGMLHNSLLRLAKIGAPFMRFCGKFSMHHCLAGRWRNHLS